MSPRRRQRDNIVTVTIPPGFYLTVKCGGYGFGSDLPEHGVVLSDDCKTWLAHVYAGEVDVWGEPISTRKTYPLDELQAALQWVQQWAVHDSRRRGNA